MPDSLCQKNKKRSGERSQDAGLTVSEEQKEVRQAIPRCRTHCVRRTKRGQASDPKMPDSLCQKNKKRSGERSQDAGLTVSEEQKKVRRAIPRCRTHCVRRTKKGQASDAKMPDSLCQKNKKRSGERSQDAGLTVSEEQKEVRRAIPRCRTHCVRRTKRGQASDPKMPDSLCQKNKKRSGERSQDAGLTVSEEQKEVRRAIPRCRTHCVRRTKKGQASDPKMPDSLCQKNKKRSGERSQDAGLTV
ncbi:hypothetical protein Bpfe_009737 [Biomphalaria pfeifferi]|uniref:Uncharacterized protein n=1 Tax=Biomphalaria pfeifferi TaxID=112525 RepID=A0AAD8BUI2_BIOPF|nr:hypothetical protein Bpfe_009737 [Biomphalaria pfeifferi]